MLLRRHLAVVAASAAAAVASSASAAPQELTPAVYEGAVAGICAHALLFEGTHAIGNRAGALEVAAAIRDSSQRRLSQVAELAAPADELAAVAQWLALEQRIADTYARSYVRIYDIITAPSTHNHYAQSARQIHTLVHAADPLRRAAALLEQQLQVPDCTGGG